MARTAMAQAELSRLRRDIAKIEGRLADEERLILDASGAAHRFASEAPGATSGSASSASISTSGGASAGGEFYANRREQNGPLGLRPRARRGRLSLGVARLDAALGGGLPLATLSEVRADESRDGGAAAGFVLALAARLAAAGGEPSIVW
ncbi:MAG: hypothetical protein ACRED5_19090, partial [Propylenella sp.]